MIKLTLAVTKWKNRKGRLLCNPAQILEDSVQTGQSKHFTINFFKERFKLFFDTLQFVETFLLLEKHNNSI